MRCPGELVHVDVKKLGKVVGVGHRVTGQRARRRQPRGGGWEFVHVCVDDCTRLAYAEALEDERADTVCAFLERADRLVPGHGIQLARVMTDNGNGYRSRAHAAVCRRLGLRHLFTEPYRPRTNGKAERFIKTLTLRWAYGGVYATYSQRRAYYPASLTTTTTDDPTGRWTDNHRSSDWPNGTTWLGPTADSCLERR